MPDGVSATQIFKPSENVVAREMEGQLILIPLVADVGDLEAELFSLNDTGRAIWDKLDGTRSVADVVRALQAEYDEIAEKIAVDVEGLLEELVRRGMVVEVASAA